MGELSTCSLCTLCLPLCSAEHCSLYLTSVWIRHWEAANISVNTKHSALFPHIHTHTNTHDQLSAILNLCQPDWRHFVCSREWWSVFGLCACVRLFLYNPAVFLQNSCFYRDLKLWRATSCLWLSDWNQACTQTGTAGAASGEMLGNMALFWWLRLSQFPSLAVLLISWLPARYFLYLPDAY